MKFQIDRIGNIFAYDRNGDSIKLKYLPNAKPGQLWELEMDETGFKNIKLLSEGDGVKNITNPIPPYTNPGSRFEQVRPEISDGEGVFRDFYGPVKPFPKADEREITNPMENPEKWEDFVPDVPRATNDSRRPAGVSPMIWATFDEKEIEAYLSFGVHGRYAMLKLAEQQRDGRLERQAGETERFADPELPVYPLEEDMKRSPYSQELISSYLVYSAWVEARANGEPKGYEEYFHELNAKHGHSIGAGKKMPDWALAYLELASLHDVDKVKAAEKSKVELTHLPKVTISLESWNKGWLFEIQNKDSGNTYLASVVKTYGEAVDEITDFLIKLDQEAESNESQF